MDILANEIMFITSHKVRNPISACIGLIDMIRTNDELKSTDLDKVLDHLKKSMVDLDEETKRLTLLLYHQDQKSRLFKNGHAPKEHFWVPGNVF